MKVLLYEIKYRPVLGIRMYLGLQDPDLLVIGMDQDPSFSHKVVERTEIFTQNFSKN
jgi:hypothetical protein